MSKFSKETSEKILDRIRAVQDDLKKREKDRLTGLFVSSVNSRYDADGLLLSGTTTYYVEDSIEHHYSEWEHTQNFEEDLDAVKSVLRNGIHTGNVSVQLKCIYNASIVAGADEELVRNFVLGAKTWNRKDAYEFTEFFDAGDYLENKRIRRLNTDLQERCIDTGERTRTRLAPRLLGHLIDFYQSRGSMYGSMFSDIDFKPTPLRWRL